MRRSGTVLNRQTPVLYPANLTLAVGASTDLDYRAHYSHYGPTPKHHPSERCDYGHDYAASEPIGRLSRRHQRRRNREAVWAV